MCGAGLEFDIKSGEMICTHCGHLVDIPDEDDRVARNKLTLEVLKSKPKWDDGRVFQCDNCGAKGVLQNVMNPRCPFCNSTQIICTNEMTGTQPDAVLPFKIEKQTAADIFTKWARGRFMTPRIFKTADLRSQMQQLYCPSWAFTATVMCNYRARLGKVYHDKDGTHVRWFNVSGTMNGQYNDHLIQASDQISNINFQKLIPFDVARNVKTYRTEYLTGITAQHYTRDLETCFADFSQMIRADMRKKIISHHNADRVGDISIDINYVDKNFNYVLLPLYVASYQYERKTYNFFINGISGKIVGKYPISWWKCFLIGLGVGLLAIAGAWLGYEMGAFTTY